jgi:homocysteine S-methyltransferase
MRSVAGKRLIVVYPGCGAQYDAGRKCWFGRETARQWSQRAAGCQRAGADIVAGCWRIGPGHIRQLTMRDTWRY